MDPILRAISLSHGQALWVLLHLGLRAGDADARLDSYVKALRQSGIPFASEERPGGAGTNLVYRYEHLMELVLALALRVQGIALADITRLLPATRLAMRPLYHRAWTERASGVGQAVELKLGDKTLLAGGAYLDLGLAYLEYGFLTWGEPRLISPFEAAERFLGKYSKYRPRLPIDLSQLAEDAVELAQAAPATKRGRP